MSPQLFFSTILMVLFLFAIWQTNNKRHKIFCIYDGADKTVQKRWVKVDSDQKVVFEGKKFDVLTQCIQSVWIRDGIHMLFPIYAKSLHFVWYSRYPIDPNDYKRTWDTPELRNMLNLSEQLKSFFRNFTPPTSKKVSGLVQYLPLISVILIFVIGFYLYSQMEGIKQVINIMQNQINAVTPR